MYKVFIDGQHGTAGSRLSALLQTHESIDLIVLDEGLKRNKKETDSCISEADLVVLCLPEKSIIEAVESIPNDKMLLDCSSIFRCNPHWVYGLPELGEEQRSLISTSKRVANPGCFATAFIVLCKPLLEVGLLNEYSELTASSINGYSAGGKRMIKRYEAGDIKASLHALNQSHKHLAEMTLFSGLKREPVFIPSVGCHKEGLVLSISSQEFLRDEIFAAYSKYENEKFVKVMNTTPNTLTAVYETDNNLEIYVTGTNKRILVTGRMSNLLKGAAGTAVQNINLMLGLPECQGL
jgi:N-acetyl-gamma-glutamyl-phosphate reductase